MPATEKQQAIASESRVRKADQSISETPALEWRRQGEEWETSNPNGSPAIDAKPSLLVLTSTFPKGPDDSTPAFILTLSKHLQRWFQVTVLSPAARGAPDSGKLEGVQVQRFHYFWPRSLELLADGAILENLRRRRWLFLQTPFLLLFELVATYRLARAIRPAVIHAHWFIPQGIVAAVVGSLLNIPVVVTALGGDVSGLRGWLWSSIRKVVASKSKAITVVSADLRNRLNGVVSATGEPPAVIPMGVDTDRLRDVSDGAAPVDKTILFVGRLAEKKGLRYLISAFPQVLSRHPDARLRVVGDGPMRAEMETLAQHLDLADHVTFVGGQSPQELRRSYVRSRVFVVPSVVARSGDTEGLPVALLEAMAAGRPIVATSVGGIPEVVIHGRTGLVVEPESPAGLARAICELLDSGSRAERLGKVARRWARRKFDWHNVAASYAALLTRVANASIGPTG